MGRQYVKYQHEQFFQSLIGPQRILLFQLAWIINMLQCVRLGMDCPNCVLPVPLCTTLLMCMAHVWHFFTLGDINPFLYFSSQSSFPWRLEIISVHTSMVPIQFLLLWRFLANISYSLFWLSVDSTTLLQKGKCPWEHVICIQALPSFSTPALAQSCSSKQAQSQSSTDEKA